MVLEGVEPRRGYCKGAERQRGFWRGQRHGQGSGRGGATVRVLEGVRPQ